MKCKSCPFTHVSESRQKPSRNWYVPMTSVLTVLWLATGVPSALWLASVHPALWLVAIVLLALWLAASVLKALWLASITRNIQTAVHFDVWFYFYCIFTNLWSLLRTLCSSGRVVKSLYTKDSIKCGCFLGSFVAIFKVSYQLATQIELCFSATLRIILSFCTSKA